MIVVPVAVDRVRTLEDAIVDPEATVIVVITDLVRIREQKKSSPSFSFLFAFGLERS